MTHRTVIRFFSGVLLMPLVIGCAEEAPTQPEGPFLQVTSPGFFGILEGSTQQLTATFDGQPATVTWETSNPAVITVSPTGLVTAIAAGNAAATATMTSDATQKRSASFTVTSPPTLVSGTPVTALASTGARYSMRLWKIIVPAGATSLSVTLSGGTGDVDLFVRRTSPPVMAAAGSTYDCSSENGGNTEVCTIPNPGAGTWFVGLGLWDPYGGVTLTATVN